jgi:hypothetical protein
MRGESGWPVVVRRRFRSRRAIDSAAGLYPAAALSQTFKRPKTAGHITPSSPKGAAPAAFPRSGRAASYGPHWLTGLGRICPWTVLPVP